MVVYKTKKFDAALADFQSEYELQKRRQARGNNMFLMGITAHNMGVVNVLAGREGSALPLFQEALEVKRRTFGRSHPEVAVSTVSVRYRLMGPWMT